ncbi:Cna B-type domain-containing protein [Lactococcus kimchii]|uniref:Cna B-type domain-containing protein n=1 Tax=Lactococcus sp. S-13 TaxID=2507158 RepID=UPI0011E4DCDA|nr:Cna B-type domain-containing protein [Lactococcus sp. S-13]
MIELFEKFVKISKKGLWRVKLGKKKRFLIALLFLAITVFVWPSIKGGAATGSDVSEDVVALTVSPTDIRDGDKVTVRFEFDEQAKNIQPGDYLNVSWPSIGAVFAQGYAKTVNLQVSGIDVGIMTIRTDGAQVVFNDNIKNLDDVKGWGEFDIQVRNLTAGDAENIGSLAVSSGGKTAKINVTKPASVTSSSVFYYKTGDMLPQDTQHVRWFLNINSGRVEVDSGVIIKDQIQSGQRLDPSTFVISVEDTNGTKIYRGENELSNLLKDYPGLSFVYLPVNNTIELSIPSSVVRYRHFGVQYKTTIENEQQVSFDNKSQAWYQEHNQPAVSGKSFDHSVQNINAAGGVQGTVKGQLKIVKRIKGTEIGIPNVNFSLKRADGQPIQGQPVITLTSDANGETGIKGLLVGDYLLQEILAPDWINFDPLTSPEQKFTVNASDTKGVDLTIYNPKKTTDIKANKVWQGGIAPRPTTYFKLYRTNVNGIKEEVPGAPLKTLPDGITEVNWSDLEEYDNQGGRYKFSVQEVDAKGNDSVPLGYSKFENGLSVINTNIEQVSIVGDKIWKDEQNKYGKRPEHITVNLLENGKPIKSLIVSDQENWHYQFNGLPKYKDGRAIAYSIGEKAVEGYQTKVEGYNLINTYVPISIPATPLTQGEATGKVDTVKTPHTDKRSGGKSSVRKQVVKPTKTDTKRKPALEKKLLPKTNDGNGGYALVSGIFLSLLATYIFVKRHKL